MKRYLKQRNRVTSTYVCMELNRTFLADAEMLETMLHEGTNLQDVWGRIRSLDHKENVKDRLELLFLKTTRGVHSLYEAKSILKRLIKHYQSILLREVTVIPSETRCEQGLYMPGYDCRGINSTCKVVDVVKKNKVLIDAVRIALVENLQRDRRVLNICWVLNDIVENPSKTKEDPRNCYDIGDILIALDVPEGFTLVSEDKHFFLICEVLNIPFHHIEP